MTEQTTEQGIKLIITPAMQEQVDLFEAAKEAKSGCYDYRLKVYKDYKKIEENAEKVIGALAQEQISMYLQENNLVISFEDGFKLETLCHVRLHTYKDMFNAVVTNRRYYGGHAISLDKPVEKIQEYITRRHNEWTTSNTEEAKRKATSARLVEKVGKVTYTSYDKQTFENSYNEKGEHYSSASVKLEIQNDASVSIDASFRRNFENEEEALKLWVLFNEFLEQHDGLTVKEERN